MYFPLWPALFMLMLPLHLFANEIKFRDEQSGELLRVPTDIVKQIELFKTLVLDLGDFQYFESEDADPITLHSLHDRNIIIDIIDALKKAKDSLKESSGEETDISTVKEWKLVQALEKNVDSLESNLLDLIETANFLDVKLLMQVLIRKFLYSHFKRPSCFHEMPADVQRAIIHGLDSLDFMSCMRVNEKKYAGGPQEEQTFAIALEVHYNKKLNQGENAKQKYEAEFAARYILMPRPYDGFASFAKTPTKILSMALHDAIICLGTTRGIAISHDEGKTFRNITSLKGFGFTTVLDVAIHEDLRGHITIYAATTEGLYISADGGNTFILKTIANGLQKNNVSADGGESFTAKTYENGLPFKRIKKVLSLENEQGSPVIYIMSDTRYTSGRSSGPWFLEGNERLAMSNDGGDNFVIIDHDIKSYVNDFQLHRYADGRLKIFANSNDGFHVSHDGGHHFSKVKVTPQDYFSDDDLSDHGKHTIISRDKGKTFERIDSSLHNKNDDVIVATYALTSACGLALSTDGKSTFQPVILKGNGSLDGVWLFKSPCDQSR